MSQPKASQRTRPEKVASDLSSGPQPAEFREAYRSIEAELNAKRIGAFKVDSDAMTFVWSDRKNRDVADSGRRTNLYNSMSKAILRDDFRHRLAGVVSRRVVEGHIALEQPDGKRTKIGLAQVEEYNKQAIFPTLTLSHQEIEMQSGQHRMVILAELKAGNKKEWYWIVDLYDHGKAFVSQIC
jgi:hypothetical protein